MYTYVVLSKCVTNKMYDNKRMTKKILKTHSNKDNKVKEDVAIVNTLDAKNV